MTDQRQPRARAASSQEGTGFDVWLPALVAMAAALFLILSVSAQEAPPRAIYSAERFAMTEAERTLLEEETARAADGLAATPRTFNRTAAPVEMRALPALPSVVSEDSGMVDRPGEPVRIATRPVLIAADNPSQPAPGWARLALVLAIAAMLGGALYLLDRTWRRTGPAPLAQEQAAA